MDEGLIVLRADGSIGAFDGVAERILGLAAGSLRSEEPLSSFLGVDLARRLLDGAPAGDAGQALAFGEVCFEIGDGLVSARATRLTGLGPAPCVLLRLRLVAAADGDTGRDLAARLSREMRVPVAAIRGCSQTLLSGAMDEAERARRFLEMMDYNIEELEQLAEHLNSFAQIAPAWIEDHRCAVDVRPILGSMARVHAGAVIRRGVAVRAVPVTECLVVAAVPQLFERSLQGVVAELLRASRRGEELTCAAAPAKNEGGEATVAEIVVARGMAAAESGPARDEDGESLRMQTVRDVVRCHGGWLAAEGCEGRLWRVRLFWPLWAAARSRPRPAGPMLRNGYER